MVEEFDGEYDTLGDAEKFVLEATTNSIQIQTLLHSHARMHAHTCPRASLRCAFSSTALVGKRRAVQSSFSISGSCRSTSGAPPAPAPESALLRGCRVRWTTVLRCTVVGLCAYIAGSSSMSVRRM